MLPYIINAAVGVDALRNWTTHTATMVDLKPDTVYFYRVGDPAFGWSNVFHFRSQKTLEAISSHRAKPQKHLVFGDMGAGYAFTLCKACTGQPACTADMCAANVSAGLVSEVKDADMMLQVGDFGYDLNTWVSRAGSAVRARLRNAPFPGVDGSPSHACHHTMLTWFRPVPRHALPATACTV